MKFLAIALILGGCTGGRERLLHAEGNRVCVEPLPLPFSAGDVTRVAHATGYLACRDAQANAAQSFPQPGDESWWRLVVLAAAEGQVFQNWLEPLASRERAWTASCQGATRETLRPRAWSDSFAVVEACQRVHLRVAAWLAG